MRGPDLLPQAHRTRLPPAHPCDPPTASAPARLLPAGASFLVKEVSAGNQKITLQIWDTAGQERFRSMAPLYYRGAVAAILVFAITDEASFDKLKEWVKELQNNVEEPLVLAIACNKADMANSISCGVAAPLRLALSLRDLRKEQHGRFELFHEVARRLVLTIRTLRQPWAAGAMTPGGARAKAWVLPTMHTE